MILISVDFPAPFSPSSAWTSPGYSSISASWSASVPPKLLVTSRATSTGRAGWSSAVCDKRSPFEYPVVFETLHITLNKAEPSCQGAHPKRSRARGSGPMARPVARCGQRRTAVDARATSSGVNTTCRCVCAAPLLGFLDQQSRRSLAEFVTRLRHRTERHRRSSRVLDVVVADDGDVVGDGDALLRQLLEQPDGDQVIGAEHCGRPPSSRHPQQLLTGLEAGGDRQVRGGNQRSTRSRGVRHASSRDRHPHDGRGPGGSRSARR